VLNTLYIMLQAYTIGLQLYMQYTIIHAFLNYRLFCSKGLLDNIMIIQLTYWSICVFTAVLSSNFVNFLWLWPKFSLTFLFKVLGLGLFRVDNYFDHRSISCW